MNLKKYKNIIHELLTCLLFILSGACSHLERSPITSELWQDSIFLKEDSTLFVYTYKENLKHGVTKVYEQTPEGLTLVKRLLFVKDTLILGELLFSDSVFFGLEIYYLHGTRAMLISPKYFDKTSGELVRDRSAFYEILAPDTIKYGEPYSIRIISNIGLWNDYGIRLIIGDVGAELTTKNSMEFFSDSRELDLIINDYKLGINLITGWIEFTSEKFNNQERIFFLENPRNSLVFFHQFIVVDVK